MAIILHTPRLTLREFTPDDLDFAAEMMSDPEVMRFFPRLATRDEARVWIERQLWRYANEGHGVWLVTDRLTGAPLGRTGLAMQDVDGVREPEVGYMIHRPHWRQGYAIEAAAAVRDWAYAERGYSSVISLVRPINLPSQAAARKLGMTVDRETTFFDLAHLVFRVALPVAT